MPTMDEMQLSVATRDVCCRQLVLAGPGTGKTETVARRLAHLLDHGTGPGQILVLSFSRSAVRTLTRRLESFAVDSEAMADLRHVSIRTFDSWAFRLLRRLDSTPADLLRQTHDENIATLTTLLWSEGPADIAALLNPVRHVIVDEFQDLAGVRGNLVLALLHFLAPPKDQGCGFTVLGDEAQAIYGFALRQQQEGDLTGITTRELIARIRADYAGELVEAPLTTNYRAVEKWAKVADLLRQILLRGTGPKAKLNAIRKVVGRLSVRKVVQAADPDRIRNGGSAAILTRTNGQAIRVWQQVMGQACEGPGIDVHIGGRAQSTTVPPWLGAVLGRFRGSTVTRSKFHKLYRHVLGSDAVLAGALDAPGSEPAWEALVRAAGAGGQDSSIDLCTLRERLDWPDLFPDDGGAEGAQLSIMTIHQSKGREFNDVSLLEQDEDADMPETAEEVMEEASVIFVAMTRAQRSLQQLTSDGLYPLWPRTFEKGRRLRWHNRARSWHNLEMGLRGDVDPRGFVDLRLHETETAVAGVQELLCSQAASLRGRKVVLRKAPYPPGSHKKFAYKILLQEQQGGNEKLLGVTTPQVTFDILNVVGEGYGLPSVIYNLRITGVVTLGLRGDDTADLAPDWAASGLWLGVNIYGTGDFKPYRWKGGQQ